MTVTEILSTQLRLGVFFCLAALGLTACGPSENKGSGKARSDLVFINGAEISGLDPVSVSDQVSGRIITSLFEGLLRYNQQGKAEAGVAEMPEISPDGLTYRFRLRPDSYWTDGVAKLRRVTAADFVTSWRRFLEPDNAAEYANVFYVIRGAEDYHLGKLSDFASVGLRAESEDVLVVQLVNPAPYFKDLVPFMCFCPVFTDLPPEKAREQGLFKPNRIVTNGAFLLGEWKMNDHILLRKNPHYWDAANVKLNEIKVLPISNASTALNLFLTGGVDLLIDKSLVPPNLGEKLRQQPYFHYKPFMATWFIRFNVTRPPFDNVKVRQAFAASIDRQRIVEKITQYGEQVATSFVPPGVGEGYASPVGPGFSPDKAQALLAEAGLANGRGMPVVDYLYPAMPIEANIAAELQSMWRKHLGVTVGLPKEEYKAYLASQRKVQFDLCRSSWIGDYNDPNTFLDMFTSNSGNNRTGWKNEEYDKLIAAAAAEPDSTKRNAIFAQAEEMILNTHCIVAPVYHYVGMQFYRDHEIGGVEANVTDEHPLRCVYRK